MNEIEALRITILILSQNLALLEKKPPGTYLGVILPAFDTNEAERQRLEEIANRMKKKPWQDWVPGVPSDQVGDNEKPDDDFLRAFKPMMDAAGTLQHQFKDSKGHLFFYPNIKKDTPGEGWMGVKRETLRMVMSEWGQTWMNDPENIKYGIVPKTAAVARLMKEVQDAA